MQTVPEWNHHQKRTHLGKKSANDYLTEALSVFILTYKYNYDILLSKHIFHHLVFAFGKAVVLIDNSNNL